MGAVKSKLSGCYNCLCCKGLRTDSYDLKELPRPPRLDSSNGRSRSHDFSTGLFRLRHLRTFKRMFLVNVIDIIT